MILNRLHLGSNERENLCGKKKLSKKRKERKNAKKAEKKNKDKKFQAINGKFIGEQRSDRIKLLV